MTDVKLGTGGSYDLGKVEDCFFALRDLASSDYDAACDLVSHAQDPRWKMEPTSKMILCEVGLMARGQPLQPIIVDFIKAGGVVGSGTDIGILWPRGLPQPKYRAPSAHP